MQITDIKIMRVNHDNSLRAIAGITLDNMFAINEMKLIEKDHLFIAMPSKPINKDHYGYKDIAHPINKETRQVLEKLIIDAYEIADKDNHAYMILKCHNDHDYFHQTIHDFEVYTYETIRTI